MATATPPAACAEGAQLSQEQAIQCILWIAGAAPDNQPDPSTATARRMTKCEALDLMGWEGVPRARPRTPPWDSPVWIVEVRGDFSGSIGYGLTPDPSPPRTGRFVQILGDGGAGAILFDERAQEGPELSREKVVERAFLEIDVPGIERDPSSASLARMTYREALDTLRREGAPQDFSERPHQNDPVWLVEVSGIFVDPCAGNPRLGKYLLVQALDGFIESSGFVPDGTPTP